jgi:hypothetical protein
VYGCLFHPELNPDTYYIIKNVFGWDQGTQGSPHPSFMRR